MERLEFRIKDWKILWFWSLMDLSDWQYKITEVKRIRSLKSNRYYWGYILKYIALEYQQYWYIYTSNSLHKILKRNLLPRIREYSDFSKKYIQKEWSTKLLKTKQFSEYIQRIEVIFEFWEMDKLWLEKIDWFVIPSINEDELLEWIDKIV